MTSIFQQLKLIEQRAEADKGRATSCICNWFPLRGGIPEEFTFKLVVFVRIIVVIGCAIRYVQKLLIIYSPLSGFRRFFIIKSIFFIQEIKRIVIIKRLEFFLFPLNLRIEEDRFECI